MSIEERFRQFASNLELSEADSTRVSKIQTKVRAILERHPHVLRTELIGSYDRKTKIRPLHDVDILVVLDYETAADGRRRVENPKLALSDLARMVPEIRKKLPFVGPRKQSRSINIRTAGVGFDLVPAFELEFGYAIPDKTLGAWITTDPVRYAKMVTARNQSKEYRQKLVPFIKMIKSWAGTNGVPFLSSYLTELLVHSSISSIDTYARCSMEFFSRAQSVVPWPVFDPVTGLDANDLTNSEKLALIKKLCFTSELAANAIVIDSQGGTNRAALVWHRVFGKDYPIRIDTGGTQE